MLHGKRHRAETDSEAEDESPIPSDEEDTFEEVDHKVIEKEKKYRNNYISVSEAFSYVKDTRGEVGNDTKVDFQHGEDNPVIITSLDNATCKYIPVTITDDMRSTVYTVIGEKLSWIKGVDNVTCIIFLLAPKTYDIFCSTISNYVNAFVRCQVVVKKIETI
jgi:hypothetical protein